jgi:hypothetical protein
MSYQSSDRGIQLSTPGDSPLSGMAGGGEPPQGPDCHPPQDEEEDQRR